MKYFVSFIVVLLVVGLPLGSWLYLQSGLKFRLELVELTKVKGPLNTSLSINDGSGVLLDELSGKTSILIDKRQVDIAAINEVNDQFDQTYTFQMVYLTSDSCDHVLRKGNKCVKLKENDLQMILKDQAYVIIDTSMNIRNWYSANDTSYLKIVEHMAVVLPRVPDKDILHN